MPVPTKTRIIPWPMTSLSIFRGCAPSASRIPISCVCWSTEYAMNSVDSNGGEKHRRKTQKPS
jgi:hypothetical protein